MQFYIALSLLVLLATVALNSMAQAVIDHFFKFWHNFLKNSRKCLLLGKLIFCFISLEPFKKIKQKYLSFLILKINELLIYFKIIYDLNNTYVRTFKFFKIISLFGL